MAEKLSIAPKGFKAFSQPMGKPADGQIVKAMSPEGEFKAYVYRDGKLYPAPDGA